MRPIRLEMEGFTSFRERVALDFTGLDLFAITGATGSGKTSLIDGVIYALYGRTPRLGAGVSELISQGATRLEVLLEFTAGPRRYKIFRSLKRGGGAVVQLEGEDGVANKAAEVRERVEQILGLDYDGFTKSVVLPQGEFDRFLRGKPEERRKILRDLLQLDVYEEMGKRANERAKASRNERAVLEQQLSGIETEASEEKRAALEAELETLTREQVSFEAALEIVQAAEPVARELREQRWSKKAAEESLAEAEGKRAQAQQAASEAAGALQEYHQKIASLERRLAEAGYDEGRYLELARLEPLARRREEKGAEIARLDKRAGESQRQAEIRIGRLEARRQAAERELRTFEKQRREARTAVETAQEALEHVRRLHSADDLRRHLVKGKPCPVCQQVVSKVPKAGEIAKIDDAQRLVDQKQRALDKCSATLVRLQAELEALPDLRGAAATEEVTETLAEARQAAEEAAQEAQAARYRLELARQDLAALQKEGELPELAGLQTELVAQQKARSLSESCRQERQRLDEQGRAAEQRRTRAEAEAAAAGEQAQKAQVTMGEAAARIVTLEGRLAELGVNEGTLDARRAELSGALAEVQKRRAVGEERLRRVVELLAQGVLLRAQMDDLRQRESLYAELGKMLAANQFVRFVLEQALRRLAAAGTQRLLQLSSGRYSFAAQEDDFYVVDHENADQQRSVHTLSGGESFLASLALALALAEGLAEFATDRESLRLESLFLDEGFSTLDAETLDVVVQGIETLADRSRLVGVSSHVSELAERLPARIRVQKSPAGSRVAVD